MMVLAVLAAILAVSFGAAIHDESLSDDLLELKALIPMEKYFDLTDYYFTNDEEFRDIIDSGYLSDMNAVFLDQPEIHQFFDWVSEHLKSAYPANVKQTDLKINNNYKPGWKGFMEAYISLFPFEKIANFVEEKVAEGGIFAEFWNRLQGLRPAYERLVTLPEYIDIVNSLEILGYDGQQYEGFLRDVFGWH